jgi:hypothetical protein
MLFDQNTQNIRNTLLGALPRAPFQAALAGLHPPREQRPKVRRPPARWPLGALASRRPLGEESRQPRGPLGSCHPLLLLRPLGPRRLGLLVGRVRSGEGDLVNIQPALGGGDLAWGRGCTNMSSNLSVHYDY